jgi:hypothetical protein
MYRITNLLVLESEAYMRFAVGVTTTFSIMARLDRIVVICKTWVHATLYVGANQQIVGRKLSHFRVALRCCTSLMYCKMLIS